MITTMALHSLTDGFAITAGHEAALHHSNKLGLLILLAVSYHKVPEGLALMGVARMSGFSKAKAFIITVLVETTTGLGALIGLLVLGARLTPSAFCWGSSVEAFFTLCCLLSSKRCGCMRRHPYSSMPGWEWPAFWQFRG